MCGMVSTLLVRIYSPFDKEILGSFSDYLSHAQQSPHDIK